MAIYNSDEESSIPLPIGDSEFSDPPSPPSVDGANQQTIANHTLDEDFDIAELTDRDLAFALSLLGPYEQLENEFAAINSKAFQSNHHSGTSRWRIHYAGVDYSKQMLAVMAFERTEGPYVRDLDKLIKDHDPATDLAARMSFQGRSAANRSLHSDLSNLPPDLQKVLELSETMFKSRQKLAMVPFEKIGSYYDPHMAKMIEYYDHRNHLKSQDFPQGFDDLFSSAGKIRDISEALLGGLRDAMSEYQAHASLGDMLLAMVPHLLPLYQAYIEALPAALADLDLENAQDLEEALRSILNLLPLPLLRLRHYPDSLASLIRLVQSSNNDLDKSHLVTLICALSLMKELVNTINSSAVNVEEHLTILLSEEFASKVKFSHPTPLGAAMVYTGRDYPEIMLLRLTFLHSEWMYNKDLEKLMEYLETVMRQNKFNAKDIKMLLVNIEEFQRQSQTLYRASDQGFVESIINMFSELARPYYQYGQHYSQVSACVRSLLQGDEEAYLLSLLALPMKRLRDYQDLIGSIVQVTESFNPDRLALCAAKSLLEYNLKMIKTFLVEDQGQSGPTGMGRPDSPPDIGHAVKLTQQYMIANGGFGSVYQGMYSDRHTRQAVAIKIFIKREIIDDAKFEKRLRREVKVWWRLQHPSVIPLLGISFDHGEYMSMISPWMEGGPLSSHLQKHASTLGIEDKLKFLNEIADGLQYLHNNQIVHGDLTTANILLDRKHNAVLSDFGMSFLVDEFVGTSYMTTTIAGGGALRWAAPELVPTWEDTNFQPVKGYKSDIYSLGGVLYHVFSGHVPFHDKKDVEIFNLVVQLRQHPERPPGDLITNSCWDFIGKCWSSDQQHRPVISDVVKFIVKERVLSDCL